MRQVIPVQKKRKQKGLLNIYLPIISLLSYAGHVTVSTPNNLQERGCQLSLQFLCPLTSIKRIYYCKIEEQW